MTDTLKNAEFRERSRLSRRQLLAASAGALLLPSLPKAQEPAMTPKAFVYTEVAISVPFDQAPWQEINEAIRQQPGFLNKTWLSGHGNNSLGGFYGFDSIENARKFVTGYFPSEPRAFGVAHNTRVFDAQATEAASRDMGAVQYGGAAAVPGAFVYTELQLSAPFEDAPWQARNKALKMLPGLQNKVWLSGLQTQTLGGFDAFDTLDHALDFAVNMFPEAAADLGCAFYTRVFDASVTETASRAMNSPYYPASGA
ncbi:YdhR family protein [Leisingera sp. McT4-56]|uniref:YdhR family protein n=1 Tax=Leisingera sp. McT4-56 TaxID=2881255 RepID=UPI001CF7FDF8|nr:YdhR family protein [Leisingera sp. McT4-56]MCB4456727.1 YdhR family protein [Leisingera sp. McT4-56]